VTDNITGFDTIAIRTGHRRTAELEHSEAIFATSSFVFENAAQAAARFSGAEPGNIYSRFTNPTTRAFEERLAAMEGGQSCVATASGMAAISSLCMATLKMGDHIVSSRSIFGTTTTLFEKYLPRFGIETSFVAQTDLIADIRKLAELAHDNNCLLVVDNCFCTPALQRPLELGADLVIHSVTKYLDGQGRIVGGAVVGPDPLVNEDVFGVIRTTGPSMSPFSAWVALKGLETLNLRMKAHCEQALQLAKFLDRHPRVRRVYHAGLESHPQHELARSQQSGFGGVVSFVVEGGRESAWQVIDATETLSITANLGDVKTTITHPSTTTHGRVSDEIKASAGIEEGLLRVAVGLENIEDIIADLSRGLDG